MEPTQHSQLEPIMRLATRYVQLQRARLDIYALVVRRSGHPVCGEFPNPTFARLSPPTPHHLLEYRKAVLYQLKEKVSTFQAWTLSNLLELQIYLDGDSTARY